MTKKEVLDLVLKSDSLPTLSNVASKLISITSKETTTVREVSDLISKDISISTKILKIVNSPFYNIPQKIGTIHQAVAILGSNALRNLVLSFSFLKVSVENENEIFDYEKFWEQSLCAAVSAKLIMKNVTKEDCEEVFVAGLLQNIGELFIARSFPGKYGDVLEYMNEKESDLLEAEQKVIGVGHPYIGYQVAKRWGFPNELLNCILYHHNPSKFTGKLAKQKRFIDVSYLAGLLSNIFYTPKPQIYLSLFRNKARQILGFDSETIDTILEVVDTEVQDVASFFGLKVELEKSIAEILQEANKGLSQLNLSYDQMNRELIETKEKLQKLTHELKEKNRLLENLVNIDGLTQVNNHRFFQTFLDKELKRAVRYNTPLSIIMVDIDHFKKFNDTYGHQTGDLILREFCKIAKNMIRESDLIARYGGEEFVFVFPETGIQEARLVAEKIRKVVANHHFKGNDETYNVTISLGVTSMEPEIKVYEKNELIELADKSLYVAKKNGRNRVVVHSMKKSS